MRFCKGDDNYTSNVRKKPKVCADDSKTYLKCELSKCNEDQTLKLVHYGECGNCQKENVCPWLKQKIASEAWNDKPGIYTMWLLIRMMITLKLKFRATDGRDYTKCEFQMARCERFNSDGVILQREYRKPSAGNFFI